MCVALPPTSLLGKTIAGGIAPMQRSSTRLFAWKVAVLSNSSSVSNTNKQFFEVPHAESSKPITRQAAGHPTRPRAPELGIEIVACVRIEVDGV